MISTRILSVAGLLAVAAALQAQPADKSAHHRMMEQCAKACSDCQRVCNHCMSHCADMVAKGMKEHKKTLLSCEDCADVCAAASQIVSRGGPYSDLICKSCADVCAKCAQACDALAQDKTMKACADECRKCEKACREMLKHMGQVRVDAR